MEVINKFEMTEKEFAEEFKRSLVPIITSSSDKREIYAQLFTISDRNYYNKEAGLDIFFTHIGAFGIAPIQTAERTNEYSGNLAEKIQQAYEMISNQENDRLIRFSLGYEVHNEFNPKTTNIMAMVEDSGWHIKFDNQDLEAQFINLISIKLKDRIPHRSDLLEKLHQTGFPGPNLKPLQECLQGSFNELMELIYETSGELGIQQLRYVSTVNVAFVSQSTGKYFQKSIESHGQIISRSAYNRRIVEAADGEAINTDFVHVPDGQQSDSPKTLDILVKEGINYRSGSDLPADYGRRTLTEYLAGLVGKRRSTNKERSRQVKFGVVSTNPNIEPRITLRPIHDLAFAKVPKLEELLEKPGIPVLGDTDVLILIPSAHENGNQSLRTNHNYGTLVEKLVDLETNPELMGTILILDNRSGKFNRELKLITDAYTQGRLIGQPRYLVANTDDEMESYLRLAKDLKQRAPQVRSNPTDTTKAPKKDLPPKVPCDEIFTVFIAGGHNNNSFADLEDAKKLGYHCAEKGYRIITGAGSLEGSMGAIHTGFIQYFIDQLKNDESNTFSVYDSYKKVFERLNYDAEEILRNYPTLIDELANKDFIPRNMFYGYSMKALLEMESKIGVPPGITYFEAGNMQRRLECLTATGTKVFLNGGIGTDEEIEKTIAQHLEGQARKNTGVANDSIFADGTPDDQGAMLFHNRSGFYDRLLGDKGIGGNDPISRANRQLHNIHIPTKIEDLIARLDERAESWLERVKTTHNQAERVA